MARQRPTRIPTPHVANGAMHSVQYQLKFLGFSAYIVGGGTEITTISPRFSKSIQVLTKC
ncbi:hypothetical protein DPMN_073869, partial [Dreissena polymorpha]